MAVKPFAQGLNDDSSLTRISTQDDDGSLLFEPNSTDQAGFPHSVKWPTKST